MGDLVQFPTERARATAGALALDDATCAALDVPAGSTPLPEPTPPAPAARPTMDRDEAIARMRAALRRRSGKAWSVTGGRGTGWGWITVTAPPARRVDGYYLSLDDAAELGELLGLDRPAHHQGESIPASSAYRRAYVDRAETGSTTESPEPYWD